MANHHHLQQQHPAPTSHVVSMVESVLRQAAVTGQWKAAAGPPVNGHMIGGPHHLVHHHQQQQQQQQYHQHQQMLQQQQQHHLGNQAGVLVRPEAISAATGMAPVRKSESPSVHDHYDRVRDNGSEESPSSSDSGMHKGNGINARPNRDPMSHRIIEKRRRDRMNNCLTNLSKMIPSSYVKKGRGRIEKTEIIEMAIRYMRTLHDEKQRLVNAAKGSTKEEPGANVVSSRTSVDGVENSAHALVERYKQGFQDCVAETLRFLVGVDGLLIGEGTRSQLLVHLRDACCHQGVPEVLNPVVFGRLLQSLRNPSPTISHQSRSRSLSIDHHLSSQNAHQLHQAQEDSDQPLNMSLKKPRFDMPTTTASLRDNNSVSNASGSERSAVIRPHVFRYAADLAKFTSTTTAGEPSTKASATLSGASAGSGSTHYPSSPSSHSHHSLSGSSAGDSPPRVVSPFTAHNHHHHNHQQQQQVSAQMGNAGVPIFALHSSGMFYVPMTLAPSQIESHYAQRLTSAGGGCHPITITVSFCHPSTSAPPREDTCPTNGSNQRQQAQSDDQSPDTTKQ